MDTITMTLTGPGAYRYQRPRETLTQRVVRLTRTHEPSVLFDLGTRWAARSLRKTMLGPTGRDLAAAIALTLISRGGGALHLLDSRERAARQGV